jgi:multisubunit Na+/H+ antiporter MnhB subunit
MTQLLVGMGMVIVFCVAVGVRDLRRKDYIWAALAFICVGVLATASIPTHAVKLKLPPQTSSTSRP